VDNSIIYIVKKERNILDTLKRRKAKWNGHISRRNCLLKHVIEGNTEGMGRRRRCKKLLDIFKERGRYWSSKRKH